MIAARLGFRKRKIHDLEQKSDLEPVIESEIAARRAACAARVLHLGERTDYDGG